MSNCTSNEDCLDSLKVCLEIEQSNEFFCDCSPVFGWKGVSCDEPTLVLWINRCSLGLLVLISIFLSIFCGNLLKVYATQYIKKRTLAYRRSVILLFSVFLALLFMMTIFILDLVPYFNSTFFVEDKGTLVQKFLVQREGLALSGLLLILFSAIQLIVVWLSYICELAVYFPEKTTLKGNQLRVGALLVMFILTIIQITLFSLSYIEIWRTLLVGVVGIGCILYIIGYFYLMNYLKELLGSLPRGSIKEFFSLIKVTYRVNLAALFVIIVAQTLLQTIGKKNIANLKIGDLNISLYFNFVSNICLFIFLASVTRFSYYSQPWRKPKKKGWLVST